MITAANTTRGAQTFMKAPNNTAFGKVFINNMDRNSFISDKEKRLALMTPNGKKAIFGKTYGKIVQMKEYKNCEVPLKKLYVSKIYYSLNELCNMFLDRDSLGNKHGITKYTNYERITLWNFYEANNY